MNCYYSNLIEGHDTHPVDIERALKADYSTDPEQRNLQLEARAHVAVQAWIDGGGLRGRAMTVAAIRECHERFGNLLPEKLLSVKDPDTGEEEVVVPGEFRKRDVKAAQHVPVDQMTRQEPLAYCGFFIARARALAACGRDGCDDATIRVLQGLRDEATRVDSWRQCRY